MSTLIINKRYSHFEDEPSPLCVFGKIPAEVPLQIFGSCSGIAGHEYWFSGIGKEPLLRTSWAIKLEAEEALFSNATFVQETYPPLLLWPAAAPSKQEVLHRNKKVILMVQISPIERS